MRPNGHDIQGEIMKPKKSNRGGKRPGAACKPSMQKPSIEP
jgi:hypothetical protein